MYVTKRRATLKKDWQAIKDENPHIRIREAAKKLGVSEAELLSTGVGEDTIRLEGDWKDMLMAFKDFGYVMSLTRNDACVLEHKGTFEDVNVFGAGEHKMGTVVGSIETRVFLKNWAFAFAHTMDKGKQVMKSIQVFDFQGTAITKIYMQEKGNHEAYANFVKRFAAENQLASLQLKTEEQLYYSESIDKEAFLSEWRALKDTHDFFPLLRNHKAHRFQALEIAEGEFSHRVSNDSVTKILETASVKKIPIMIFVGNKGNLQIHQDVVKRIIPMERGGQNWINVMDPEFNLHLRRDLIFHTWVVEKPTDDGVVTSVEVFDVNNNMIVQIFGLRKPGQSELIEWKQLTKTL